MAHLPQDCCHDTQVKAGLFPHVAPRSSARPESQRWEAYYDAQTNAQKVRLALLRDTGTLLDALK